LCNGKGNGLEVGRGCDRGSIISSDGGLHERLHPVSCNDRILRTEVVRGGSIVYGLKSIFVSITDATIRDKLVAGQIDPTFHFLFGRRFEDVKMNALQDKISVFPCIIAFSPLPQVATEVWLSDSLGRRDLRARCSGSSQVPKRCVSRTGGYRFGERTRRGNR